MIGQRWEPGRLLEYESFNPVTGWTVCQVVRYAPAAEQWLICPSCAEQSVPGPGPEDRLRRCGRCGRRVLFPLLPPLLDVRTSVGSSLVRVRESQCREHRPPCLYEDADGDPAIRVCVTHDPDLGLHGDEECAGGQPGRR